MMRFNSRSLSTVLGLSVLVTVATLGGCGYKDKPVAPSQIVPKAVTDLQYELNEKGVTLYWSYPRETLTGAKVDEVSSFDLYRAVVPVDQYCKTCPVPYQSPIDLPGGAMPDQGGRTASYQMTVLRPGNLYFFKVRSKTGWWSQSEDSNTVSFLWNTPPMAPEGITVSAGDGKNMLRWNPVNRHQDGTPISEQVLYQIHRSVDGAAFAKTGEPLPATSYVDTQVENGKSYAYQVQAVNIYKEGSVAGELSGAVNANPMDKTAPPTPGGVQGIRTDVGIKVFWNHVKAADLMGYKIYRRAEGEGTTKFVGEVLLPYNLFIDKTAPTNVQLSYSVSSVDNQKPANESARSAEVVIGN